MYVDTCTHLGGSNRKVFAEKEKIETKKKKKKDFKKEVKRNRKDSEFCISDDLLSNCSVLLLFKGS